MKNLTFILILFSVFLVNAQTAFRIQAIELVKEGDAFLQQGDWDKALFTYTNAIQADVTYAEAYMKRARLYEMTTHTTEASIDYQQAILLNPYVDVYYNDKTLLKLVQTNYYGAYKDITQTIELRPESNDYKEEQYQLFIQLDLYTECSADSGYGINYTPEHLQLLKYFKNNEMLDAIQLVDSTLAKDPSDFIALDFKGLYHLIDGNLEDALTAFNQSIEINDSYFPSLYNRSIVNRYLGELESAKSDINRALHIHDCEDAYFKRALINKENGNLNEAVADYNQAVTLNEDFNHALYNRAFANKILGNYEASLNDIELLLEKEPDNADYWDMKGSIYMLYGELDQALICFNQAISYNNTIATYYYHRGLAYTLLQSPIRGCEDLQYSMELGLEQADVIFDSFCGF